MKNSAMFQSLHHQSQLFVMPNAWCEGSARLIENLGYASLGTTSAGIAYTQGYRDSSPQMTTEARFRAIERIVQAVDIPVSADLENGLASTVPGVQESFKQAVLLGCAGASIEDISHYDDPVDPVFFRLEDAAERVCAACEASHSLDKNFVVTARTDFLLGAHDYSLREVIARLVAFEEAGADCLFAPGIKSIDDLEIVRRELTVPVSVLPEIGMTIAKLSLMGVQRVSLGSSIFRAAYSQISLILQEIQNPGAFDFQREILSSVTLDSVMR